MVECCELGRSKPSLQSSALITLFLKKPEGTSLKCLFFIYCSMKAFRLLFVASCLISVLSSCSVENGETKRNRDRKLKIALQLLGDADKMPIGCLWPNYLKPNNFIFLLVEYKFHQSYQNLIELQISFLLFRNIRKKDHK